MPSLTTSWGNGRYNDTRTTPTSPIFYVQIPGAVNGRGTGVWDSALSIDTIPTDMFSNMVGGDPGFNTLVYDLSVARPPSPFRTSPGPSQGRFWSGGL